MRVISRVIRYSMRDVPSQLSGMLVNHLFWQVSDLRVCRVRFTALLPGLPCLLGPAAAV